MEQIVEDFEQVLQFYIKMLFFKGELQFLWGHLNLIGVTMQAYVGLYLNCRAILLLQISILIILEMQIFEIVSGWLFDCLIIQLLTVIVHVFGTRVGKFEKIYLA